MEKQAILCVDDERIILLSLVQELRNAFGKKYLYEKAETADEALAAIDDLVSEGIHVILIISDWLMPGIKGDEFLESVSLKHPGIKAVMITGHADREAIERVNQNASVLAVLKKPWDSDELIGLIAGACEN